MPQRGLGRQVGPYLRAQNGDRPARHHRDFPVSNRPKRGDQPADGARLVVDWSVLGGQGCGNAHDGGDGLLVALLLRRPPCKVATPPARQAPWPPAC
jgi:hypothetical protein